MTKNQHLILETLKNSLVTVRMVPIPSSVDSSGGKVTWPCAMQE